MRGAECVTIGIPAIARNTLFQKQTKLLYSKQLIA